MNYHQRDHPEYITSVAGKTTYILGGLNYGN